MSRPTMEKWALYSENINNAEFISITDVITTGLCTYRHLIAVVYPNHMRLELLPPQILSFFSKRLESNAKVCFHVLLNTLFSQKFIKKDVFLQIAHAIAYRMQETQTLLENFLTFKKISIKWNTAIFDDRMEIIADEMSWEMGKVKKVRIIQNAWRNAVGNPAYFMCRRRLEREFHDLDAKFSVV